MRGDRLEIVRGVWLVGSGRGGDEWLEGEVDEGERMVRLVVLNMLTGDDRAIL